MTTTMHAHFTKTSQDCDGRYDHDYVVVNEYTGEDAEFRFQRDVLGQVVSFCPDDQAELVIDSDGDLEYHEQTEEGYRHTQVRFCTHECNETVSLFRDFSAEAAGY